MKDNLRTFGTVAAVLLVVVASYAVGRSCGKRSQAWRASVAAHHTAVDHCQALGVEVNKRVQMACKGRISLADFEKEFGEVVAADPGKSPEAGKDTTHIYTHQASHRVFHLRFKDGVLLGYGSSHGPDDIQPYFPSIEQRMKDIK